MKTSRSALFLCLADRGTSESFQIKLSKSRGCLRLVEEWNSIAITEDEMLPIFPLPLCHLAIRDSITGDFIFELTE
jgi:hypothetical protein